MSERGGGPPGSERELRQSNAEVKLRPPVPSGEAAFAPGDGREVGGLVQEPTAGRRERQAAEAQGKAVQLDAARAALAHATAAEQADQEEIARVVGVSKDPEEPTGPEAAGPGAAADQPYVRPAVPIPTAPEREHVLRRIMAKSGEAADRMAVKGNQTLRKGVRLSGKGLGVAGEQALKASAKLDKVAGEAAKAAAKGVGTAAAKVYEAATRRRRERAEEIRNRPPIPNGHVDNDPRNMHIMSPAYERLLAERGQAEVQVARYEAERDRRRPEMRTREARRDPVTEQVRRLELSDLPLVAGGSYPPSRPGAGEPRPEGPRRPGPRGSEWPKDADATFVHAMDAIGDTPGTRGRVYRGGEYAGGGSGSGGRSEHTGPRGDHGPTGGHGSGHEAGGGHEDGHGHGGDILPGEGPYAEPTLTTYDPVSGEVITNPRYKEVDLRFIETQLNELRAPHETGGVSIGGEMITEQQVALVDRFCEKYGVKDWKDIKAAVYADTHLGDRPRRPDMPKRGIKRMPPWAVFTELPRCIWEDHTPLKTLDRSRHIAFGLFETNVPDVFLLSVVEVSPRRKRKSGENQISGLVAAYAVRAEEGRKDALKVARAYAKRQKYLAKGIIRDPGHTFDTHAKIQEGDHALLAAGISNEAGPTVLPGELEKRPDGTIVYNRSEVWAGVDDDELNPTDDSRVSAEELGDLSDYRGAGAGPKRSVPQRGDRVQSRGGALGLGPSGRKGWPRPESGGAGPTRGPGGGAGPAGDAGSGDSGGLGGQRGPRGPRPMPAGGAPDGTAEATMRVPSMAFGLGGESGTAGSVWRLVPPGEETAGPARLHPVVRPAAEAPAPTVGFEAPRRRAPSDRPAPPDRPAPSRAPVESSPVPSPAAPVESSLADQVESPLAASDKPARSASGPDSLYAPVEPGPGRLRAPVEPGLVPPLVPTEMRVPPAPSAPTRPAAGEPRGPRTAETAGTAEGGAAEGRAGRLFGRLRKAAENLNERVKPVPEDRPEVLGRAAVQAAKPEQPGGKSVGEPETRPGGFQSYAARPASERRAYPSLRRPTDRDGGDDSIAHTRINTGEAGDGGQHGGGESGRVDVQTEAGQTGVAQLETAAAEQDYLALRTADEFVAAADAILSRGDLSRPAALTELDRLMQVAQDRRLVFPIIDEQGQTERLQPQQYLMYRLTHRPRKGGERS